MVIDVLTVDITQNDTTICEGDSLVLLANSSQFYTNGNESLEGPIANNLAAYWTFSNNATDQSGNGIDGIVNGATLTADASGNSNSAYSFDGTSYIEIPNSSFINNYISLSNRTINLQFKTNDASVRQTIWTEGSETNGISIYLYNSKIYAGVYSNSNFWSGNWLFSTVTSNQWHSISFIFSNSGNLELFVDGNSVASSTGGSSLATHNPAFIGGNMDETITHDNNTSANNFIGIIDNVTIWNRALSTQEIQQLYTSSNYTYSWLPNGESTSSITAKPTSTTTYAVDGTSGTTTCQSDVTISVNQRDFVTVDSTACTSIEWKGATV